MRVFLVRHGIAQDHNPAGDFERKLTLKGKENLIMNFNQMKNLKIINIDKTKVISSPLIRAIETADILVEELGLKNYSKEKFVALGSLKDLYLYLKDLNSDDTVIVVGHEPSLSNWIYKITEKEVKVRKGSIHELNIDPENKKGKYLGEIFTKN